MNIRLNSISRIWKILQNDEQVNNHRLSRKLFNQGVIMKRLIILGMALTCLLGACTGDKSKELFETAQFEEKQNNREHARKLYQEIITKYPSTLLAKQAAERVAALEGKP